MAITNATRLADFGTGIGTAGAVIDIDNANAQVGLGTTNPNSTVTVGPVGASGTSLFVHGDGRVTGVLTAANFSGDLTGAVTSSGALSVTDTTASTSTTTGALKVSGGVGIAKSLFVGEGVSIAGTITYNDVTNIDSVGIVTAGGGLRIGTGGTVGPVSTGIVTYFGNVSGTVDASGHSTFTTIKTSGITTVSATTDSGSTTTGSLIISGGVGIAKSSYLGNNVNFADGKGLDFTPIAAGGWGAVAGAATTTTNVLDCYEEGTWVPILYGTDTAGSFSASVNNGWYTRVGRLVCASFYIQGGALSSSSGNWLVKGFPFNWNSGISEGGYVWYQGTIGAVSSDELAMPLGQNNQAVMRFFEIPTGGGSVASLSGDHSGITVGVTCIYQTN